MLYKIWEVRGACLYVGSWEDAVSAGGHVERIVNCADVDYPFAASCHRRWLHINFRYSS